MPAEVIKISGARQHNLKNLHVEISREKLVVITGLSGSGKSSLAFDTLYAEGQRRYVESLSAYARQFLDQMEKPDVEPGTKIVVLAPLIENQPGENACASHQNQWRASRISSRRGFRRPQLVTAALNDIKLSLLTTPHEQSRRSNGNH